MGWESIVMLARAVGVAVGRRSGGRLATTLVATISAIIFFFTTISPLFFGTRGRRCSRSPFRRSTESKNLFCEIDSKCPIA